MLCPTCKIRPKRVSPAGKKGPYCPECSRSYEQRVRSSKEARAHISRLCKIRHALDPRARMLYAAKRRAACKNIPFGLVLSDISVPEFCPVLGIKLAVGGRACKDSAPSLDRLIPGLGYVPGNVRVVSWRANSLKSDATLEELERVLAYMRSA